MVLAAPFYDQNVGDGEGDVGGGDASVQLRAPHVNRIAFTK